MVPGVFVLPCPLRGVGCGSSGPFQSTCRGTAHINDNDDNDENDEIAGAWTWIADGTLEAGSMGSADWTEELPWQPGAPGEAAGLISAYRQARLVADELFAVLVAASVDPVELAELCPSLDAD